MILSTKFIVGNDKAIEFLKGNLNFSHVGIPLLFLSF